MKLPGLKETIFGVSLLAALPASCARTCEEQAEDARTRAEAIFKTSETPSIRANAVDFALLEKRQVLRDCLLKNPRPN